MHYAFDLDGTLCNNEHRAYLVQGPDKDWEGFFQLCHNDFPIRPMCAIATALFNAGHMVSFWSGRPESSNDKTRHWLVKHLGEWTNVCTLLTRRDNDLRSGIQIREDFLRFERPDLVFEDNEQIIGFLNRLGVSTLHVSKGERE
jgi:hypothetical protein